MQGILSSVYLDERILHGWKMISIPFHNLNNVPKINPIIRVAYARTMSARTKLERNSGRFSIVYKIYESSCIRLTASFGHVASLCPLLGYKEWRGQVNVFVHSTIWSKFFINHSYYVQAPYHFPEHFFLQSSCVHVTIFILYAFNNCVDLTPKN